MLEVKLRRQLLKANASSEAFERSNKLLNAELSSMRHRLAVVEAELAEKTAEIKELRKPVRKPRTRKEEVKTDDNDDTNSS